MTTMTTTKLKTNIDKLELTLPLYQKYPSQNTPQPAWLVVNEDEAYFYTQGDIGNTCSVDVFNGAEFRFSIPSDISKVGLEQFLEIYGDTIQALIDGLSREYDGSNWRGVLTAEAEEALEELEQEENTGQFENFERHVIYEAVDYLNVAEDEIITRLGEGNLADNLRMEFEGVNDGDGPIALVGVEEYLEELKEDLEE